MLQHSRRGLLSIVVASAVLVGWPRADASPAGGREVLAFHVRGRGPQEASAPAGRFVRTFDVYPITGGDRIGTVVQDFAFTGATTGDHIMTFRLADGQFVNHTVLSFAPDSAHTGFVFTGLHPGTADTLVPGQGTGRYAGRPGRIRMAGWHDVNEFPAVATLDDFYVIEFDR